MKAADDTRREDRPTLGWGVFALKMAIGLGWMAAMGPASNLAESEGLATRLAGAALIGVPPFLWMAYLGWQAQVDELEAQLARSVLTQGCWWALAYGALMYGFYVAILQAPAPGLFLALLPAGAFLFGETMAQVARWTLSRAAGPRGPRP